MLTLLAVGRYPRSLETALKAPPFGPFAVTRCADLAAAAAAREAQAFDAVLVQLEGVEDADATLRSLAVGSALLVVGTLDDDAERLLEFLRCGAEDVLASIDLAPAALVRRLRFAVERKRIEQASRRGYATDLATGLPHQQQLVEHMSQLLALREREPAPMAVLVLRVEGFATTEARLGPQAADSLRRKIAVRLRAAVRASDVVAAIDDETFAVLLSAVLTAADAESVAAKLAQSLMQPFSVGGGGVAVAVAVGIGQYPTDGTEPEPLLRKAIGMALDEPAQGRVGMANFLETGARSLDAANDA